MGLYVHWMCSDVCVALPRTGHHYDLSVCLCEFRYICVFRLNVMACPLTLGCAPVQKSLWGPCWWLQIQLSGPLILNSLVINRVWQLRRSRTDRPLRSYRRTSRSDVGMHTVLWFGPGRLYEMQTDGQTGGRMKTEGQRDRGTCDQIGISWISILNRAQEESRGENIHQFWSFSLDQNRAVWCSF